MCQKLASEIMKIVDERETQKTTKEKQKGARGTEAIVKGRELNDCVVHLSWGAYQKG